MIGVLLGVRQSLGAALQWRWHLLLENIALRHKPAMLSRTAEKPRSRTHDRLLWIGLRAIWSRWERALVIRQTVRETCASGDRL
jgi:hypothetical protein